jgi:gliding motility-associated-like protein
VITNPNALGLACNFIDNGVSLAGKNGSLGLPNFVPFYFKTPPPPFTFTVGTVSCLTAQFNAPSSTTTSCASSGYTINAYNWNFGDPGSGTLNTSTLTTPSHLYPGPGTYSVSLILNYPCGADTIKQNITVVSPSVTVNTTSATCSVPGSGTVTTIGGTGPYTYTWTPTAQTTSVATGLVAGTYTVQVKDAIGCLVTKTVAVLSNNVMTGTVTSSSITCNGGATGSASLSITGGTAPFSYTWTGGVSTTSVASGLAAGIYTVSGADASAICVVTQTIQITQPTAVTVTAVASTPTACAGNNITLTANALGGTGAGYTFTWTSGPSTSNYIVNQGTGGAYTYTVTAADGNGCTKITNVSVNFINNPNLATTSSTICTGATGNLTVNGATNYTWMPGGSSLTNYTASPASTTIYTVTGANGACVATATAQIQVNTLPVINMASNNVQCNGQTNGSGTANVSGNGPFTYVWSSFPVQNTSTANNLGAGNYNVQVTDNNGCISTVSITITQPTALNLTINSNTTQVCAGSPINLNANGAGGTGAINYVWNPGPNTSAYSVTQNSPGNYNYSVTATDANGCSISSNINLTFNPQPTVTVSSATVCAGDIAILTANGANTYVWSGGQTGNTFTTTTNSSLNISVIGTAIGCTGSANGNITVNPLPNISISASVLSGCVPLCSDLKSTSSSGITSYNWTMNGGGISSSSTTQACFNQGGTYTVGLTVIDNNGCANSSNLINLIASPQPVADFNYDPIKPLAGSDMVSFTDASYQGNIVSWNWYFMNNGQYTSQLQNPNFMYADAGDYVIALVVKNDKNCSDTILKSIQVGEDFGIYMPNSFTPNGDGLNDTYYGKGFGIKKMEMQIFDRWGEKVFTSSDLNEAWDGTMMNKAGTKTVQEGVYTWRIKLTNVFGKSKELTGHVTLIK